MEKEYGKDIQKCETYIKMHNKILKKYQNCYIIISTKTIKHSAHCYYRHSEEVFGGVFAVAVGMEKGLLIIWHP